MALLGSAAMLLWYDIVPDQIGEHDEWHTREHFPERVGIPGFMRAQRWVATSPGPRYFVVYEVADIDVLTGAPYLERLNNPTPWTRRTMPHFRGMVRGFCTREHSHGSVLGTAGVTVRYSAAPGEEHRLHHWLRDELLPDLMARKGLASAFMLRADRAPAMTAEQRIRGRDASVDRVLFVTGYAADVVAALVDADVGAAALERHGAAPGSIAGTFQLACLSGTARGVDATRV